MHISIITINFNNLHGLKKTMTSVLQQSYSNIEFVVIDGGSTDGSKAYIESCQDDLAYWVSEPDKGIYNAMNKGIDNASGDYLLFLNSGDVLINDTIMNNVSLELGEFDIYYGDLIKLDKNGLQQLRTFPEKLSFNYFFNRGALPHPSTFIKKKLFNDIAYYNENYKIASDWEFLLIAICKYNVTYKYLNFPISVFENGGISMNPTNEGLVSSEIRAILDIHFPLFVEDYEKFMFYDKLFRLNRFKYLSALEESFIARKINSVWLTLLRYIFINK